ncbi:carbohydrate ABC transporter permease [Streptomyces coeruleorubidus]|uniref:Carbohydrate ABC transporter permease n=1 Tax=Streptomyces coeruleorubidus TaxID=116188 RepID=A0A5J6I8H6_STRC4|nr:MULTISPECIES: carbohydrate ABC transporter permease [Streptomyces]MDG9709103.1 carbohydrate ABC transporter permease [Streptomyces sp. DH10]QEV28509.1 carbohydrate ABC transporter permease [Streptomyces coeruleorubidus]WOT33507.1 carbohydrate ABC transporter permease [Streptomyces coeruleorubidus]GGT58856.1 sugar ABC transporter permease [Streptomyces coeruleorubidus]GGU43204.1 sugar ABC transporter permease [Streptomyces bellus]
MTRRAVARALVYLSLVLATLVVLLPLTVVFLTSLKTSGEMADDSGALTLPDDPLNFGNYVTAFQDGRMLSAFGNTALILVVAIGGTVLIGSMTAYAIDRFRFRFRKLVLALFLVAALVPGVTTQVATFQIVNSLGMFDSLWAPIALYMGTDIVSIYIFLQFVRAIPVSLDESARIDGANAFTVYRKIIFPLLKPAIATVVIVKGINVYNDFYIPFLYMPSEDLGVISTSLFRFKGPFGAHWETISAGAILVIVPTLIVFLFLQRFIYNGFTRGATK